MSLYGYNVLCVEWSEKSKLKVGQVSYGQQDHVGDMCQVREWLGGKVNSAKTIKKGEWKISTTFPPHLPSSSLSKHFLTFPTTLENHH